MQCALMYNSPNHAVHVNDTHRVCLSVKTLRKKKRTGYLWKNSVLELFTNGIACKNNISSMLCFII